MARSVTEIKRNPNGPDAERLALGRWLQAQRMTLGLTGTELGAFLGVSQRAVSKWEAGGFDPRRRGLLELAMAHYACLHP